MLEKWKKCVGKGKVCGVLSTDLSKAFGCLDHKLLTAKLNAYSFNLPALRLIYEYLSNREQRMKIQNKILAALGWKLYLELHTVQY